MYTTYFMDVVNVLYTLMITFVLLNKKSYAQKSVCHDQFNGFQIDEQYNRNDPPSTNTEIEINHYLHKIDEVES